jgi:ATP sulfurylase
MAVRAAHDLLAARPHAQWAIFMLQCTDELGAVWNAHLLGPDHADLGRINRDRHVALNYLIQHAAEELFKAFPEEYGTWQKAFKVDFFLKKMHFFCCYNFENV